MTTLQERLESYLKHVGITPRLFENYSGLANGAARSLNTNMRKGTYDRIAQAYPTLNMKWLLTGEGEMLQEPQVIQNNQHGDNINGSTVSVNNGADNERESFLTIIRQQSEQLGKWQDEMDKLVAVITKLTGA